MTASRQLARYLVESALGDIPQDVCHEARRAFVNWLGCALGGGRDSAIDVALAALTASLGPPVATFLARRQRMDAPHAALLNCLSASAHGFDDTHPATIIHPTRAIASALISVVESHVVSGAELIHALILGIEVECRLGNALIPPPAKSPLGFLPTGLVGAVGAAVAVGTLRRFDETRMLCAIGIAAGTVGGFREAIGSMAATYFLATTARNGLVAALLAEKGLTASETNLEGPKGYFSVYADPPNLAALTDGLGQRFELSTNTYKPYPCGVWVHPTIDVCLDVVKTHDIAPDAIEAVRLTVNPRALAIAGRKDPNDRTAAQASLYHWAAAALISRRASFAESSDAFFRDPRVSALRQRIGITADEGCAVQAASGEVTLRDGRVLRAAVTDCRGSQGRPLTDDELSEKFLGQASAVLPDRRARELLARCWEIDAVDDVGALLRAFFA